jgi:membrane-bound lytic murein transglycosylase F
MRKCTILYGLLFLLITACNHKSTENQDGTTSSLSNLVVVDAPIENPLKTKKLKLIVSNNFNTFFVYKGDNFGLEYELLSLFLESKNIELEIIVIKDTEHIRDSMHAMGAHMAASTFIAPKGSIESVKYSNAFYTTNLVLVKHIENRSNTRHPIVIKNAPYVKHIWFDSTAHTDIVPIYSTEVTSKETLLKEVHNKKIESTIADIYEFQDAQAFFPNIIIDTIIEKDAEVAFMFHSKMDPLLIEFNKWLAQNKNTSDYQWILKKYQSLPDKITKVLSITPIDQYKKEISLYDKIIKEYAGKINWDWRLIASLIHQESKFNPKTVSWVGACGLMQLMPRTAMAHAHVTRSQLFNPTINIKTGTNYLTWLEMNFFNDSSLTEIEKKKW